jgi:hypothetical protein
MFRKNFTTVFMIGAIAFTSFHISRRVFASSSKPVSVQDEDVEQPVPRKKVLHVATFAAASSVAPTTPSQATSDPVPPDLASEPVVAGVPEVEVFDETSPDPQEGLLRANEAWEDTRESVYSQLGVDENQYEQIKHVRREFQIGFYEAYRSTGDTENPSLIEEFDQQIAGILGSDKFQELKNLRDSYVSEASAESRFSIDERNRW